MNAAIKNRMSGMSLVELMVALAISVLLLMGVVALFVSSRASYETTERNSRIQENGRFALDQIATDIRASGFMGCSRPTAGDRMDDFAVSTVIDDGQVDAAEAEEEEEGEEPPPPPTPDLRWNFAEAVRGFNTTGDGWEPVLDVANLNPDPSVLGDVLVLRIPRREVRAVETTETQLDQNAPLMVGSIDPTLLKEGDTVTISDCEARAFFQVTDYVEATGELLHEVVGPTSPNQGVHTPGNDSTSLIHKFKKGSEILPVTTVMYYIAPSRDDNDGNDDVRMSLYRKNGGAVLSDEIAEGIERLEVVYGVDRNPLDGRVDQYVAAQDVTDWDFVMTVQIALLARAPDEFGTDRDTQSYVLLTTPELVQTEAYNDRNLRKVFTATLAVRNQIFD